MGRRDPPQVLSQTGYLPLHLGRGRLLEPSGSEAHTHGRNGRELKRVGLERRPCVRRVPGPVVALKAEHELKRLLGLGRQPLVQVRIPGCQRRGEVHDFCGVHSLLELCGTLGEPLLETFFEKDPEGCIGLPQALGELWTKDPVPTRGVTRDAAAVVCPRPGSTFQVGDRPLDGQILRKRFILRRRRNGDVSVVILVQAVVGLLRVRLRAEKRDPNRQSDCGVHVSHGRAQSSRVGEWGYVIVDASRVAGQPARLYGIVRQPETRMLDEPAGPMFNPPHWAN